MGVRISLPTGGDRSFPHARDWFVTMERVLQVYQEYDGNEEYVVAEYNIDAWDAVEFAPLPEPQPADVDRSAVDEENYDV